MPRPVVSGPVNSWGGHQRPVVTVGAVVAGALGVSVAGCADHASSGLMTPTAIATTPSASATSATPTTAVPTSAPSGVGTTSATANTAEKARIRAAWRAGKPAKDLIWRIPTDPPSWTKLPKEQDGLQQWHVKPGCYVRLWQLDGAGGKNPMTARDVLEVTAEANSALFPGKPKPAYRNHSIIKTTAFVGHINDVGQVKMAAAYVDYGKARAQVVAYRDGDLALSYTSYCSTAKSFTKVSASDFNAWRGRLAEETYY